MLRTALVTALALTATVGAQTQELRGKVEDVQNTNNQFFLDCTGLPLMSTAFDLNAWIGLDASMQVTNVGTAANPMLRVDGIQAIPQDFEMGGLRFGQARNWTVFAPAGSFTLVALDFTDNTGYSPYAGLGTYLLGASPFVLTSGFTGANNQFQFQFLMPNAPTLTGISMSSQALIAGAAGTYFSNPDCKTIRP